MKTKLFSLAAATALMFATTAQADILSAVYGNTMRVETSDGQIVNYFFNEDQTFSTAGAIEMSGTWTLEGSTFCTTVDGETACNEIEERAIGDSWEEDDNAGGTRKVSLIEGR